MLAGSGECMTFARKYTKTEIFILIKNTSIIFILYVTFISIQAHAASFNFSLPSGTSNVSGIAVDSASGDIYMSTLSYGGQDNLWRFSSSGTLINSTRIDYELGSFGNYSLASFGPNNKIYSYAAEANGDGTFARKIMQIDTDGGNVQELQNLDG